MTATYSPGDGREAALARLKRKRKFANDLFFFLSVNAVLWLIWLLGDRSTDGSIPWPAWVTIIWGFFVLADAWKTYGRWAAREITDADIEREMERRSRS